MNKRYLLWSVVLSSVFIGSLLFFKLLNTEDQPLNIVDINALQNGDAVGTKSLNPVTKRPFKNIQQGGSKSKSDGEAVKAIASALSVAMTSRDDDRLPSLDDAKSADLLALKSRFGSTGVSDIKYDRLGQVRAIYDSIATGSFDYKDNVATGEAISAIGETHKALFGLGAEGVVTGTKVSCADDICATKLRKSFYGLPAWDHEQTVSTKEHTIFGITGVFVEPRLAAPHSYVSDENNFRIAIAKHFSVDSDSVEFDKAAELGIARLGTVDYYAFRLENVSVGGAPYEVFVDAETGNVAKASTLVYESAVSASGTALDDSTVSFQAIQNGSSYQMIDSRFPLGYKTYVYDLSSDSIDLIESDSASSGWPASAVSVLEFTKESIDYFKESHNYDAIDPSGSDLFIGVNLDEETATFNSFSNLMRIGIGAGGFAKLGLSLAAAKDVVGHEITHGIVAGSSNLQYRYQSGALNESFSDFFGSMIDGGDWYVGEDLLSPSGKPLRNMANPKDALVPQPSHYSEYESHPVSYDSGGVHINSGIPNRALYLLAEGLSSETLGTSIGREKAADLTFKTMIGLTPNSTFDEAAERMINLAKTEYASEPAVYDATVLAWQSVGLPQSTITKSSVTNAVVSSKDVTAVAYLKPYLSTSLVSPPNNSYTLNVEFFLNSSPEFDSEANFSIVTDELSGYTRPVLVSTPDSEAALIYQRKVDDSFYMWTGVNDNEVLIDDEGIVAGLDSSSDGSKIAFSVTDTNIIITYDSAGTVTHEVTMPSTAENIAGQPVTYIDVVRFDPTGRFVVFDFFACALDETDCSTGIGNWSIGILDIASGSVEFPFPSQPARFDVGFPAFSNLTDQYITLDVVEYTEDEGVNSGVYMYDRRTGDTTWVAATDGATEKEGAYGYPSFSADDSSIVYSVTFDDFQGMYNVLLDDYAIKDVETPVSLLNPSVSFKSYAAALPASSNVPSLSLSKSSLDFGDVIRVADKSLQLCLENKGSFPIDIYDSTMPTGFKWNGDNRIISEGESVCSPVTVSSASRELGSFDTTFSIVHNGANSPTPVSVSGIVDIDTDLDGIANNKDADDDGDGTDDLLDALPLDATETIDTDSDGIGNNADSDDDGDGSSDDEEISNGSPPLVFNGLLGNWKLSSASDSIIVRSDTGNDFSNALFGNAEDRDACWVEDLYSFSADSSFSNIQGLTTSISNTQALVSNLESGGCQAPIAPHDGSTNGLFSYNPTNGELVLSGQGSFIGIPDFHEFGYVVAFDGSARFVSSDGQIGAPVPNSRKYNLSVVSNDELHVTLVMQNFPIDSQFYDMFVFVTFTLIRDTDFDDDGIDDIDDAFPYDVTEALDTDSDGIGNNADTDDDGDDVADGLDAFPLDAAESIDTDSDGIGNNADTDDDGDGVADGADVFPLNPSESIDTDSDGIGNNADTDDDEDGVADGADAFPLDAAESLDSDSDGVGNNADAFPLDASWSGDVDDDGMPDSWESQYGLDADDVRYDADNDLDGDGISNLDEFTAGSDPTRDELPPVLVIPEDITLSAVGRLTGVNLGTATATDKKDGVLTPVASISGPFQSGQFEIVWTISDAAGNVSKDSQMLTVLPLINLGPSSFVVEDSTLEVAIALSGLAPVYPVIIPVTIGGSATLGADFTVSGEQIVVADGRNGSLTISILADTESDAQETISITLGEPTNASLGAISQRTLTIIEGNVAPQLNLSVSQGGGPTRTVYADGGTVSVTANYTDLNVGDSQTLSWDTGVWATVVGLVPEFTFSGLAVSFEPAGLSEMTFPISATVTDDGNPVLETSKTVAIKLLGVTPTLDAVADSDGDGISDAAEGFGDSDDDGIPDYKDNISESYLAPMAGDSNRVMQAPVGTKITLGDSAFEAGDDSIGISEDALADIVGSADDDYNYPGGLYDFSVTGAKAGDSYRLVLPLASAVPENGIFRKYIDTNIGWQDFVITANNSIATALASDDACPEPGSSLYVSGLKAGDTCIELLIEDGGANDSDGAADGTVTDPSGLAVLYFGPPSSSSTIILSAAEIEANGSDTVTVTVTATDSDGRLLEGLGVTATASINDVSIGTFIDGGEGIYTATATAGNTAGGLTIAATIDDGSSNITITSSSMTLKQKTVSNSNQGSSAAASSGGGGCTVGVNNSPDASLMLLMLLALLVSLRRKLVAKKIILSD